MILGKYFFLGFKGMHNHRLVDLARRTVRNSLTAEQRDEIKKAANDGKSASMIRLKQGLIKKQKEHEISDLVKEIESGPNWTNHIYYYDDKHFNGCSCISQLMAYSTKCMPKTSVLLMIQFVLIIRLFLSSL